MWSTLAKARATTLAVGDARGGAGLAAAGLAGSSQRAVGDGWVGDGWVVGRMGGGRWMAEGEALVRGMRRQTATTPREDVHGWMAAAGQDGSSRAEWQQPSSGG